MLVSALGGLLLTPGVEPPALAWAQSEQVEAAAARPKRHRKRQERPVRMGTSGGSVADFTRDPPLVTCCSGTLGALLKKPALDDPFFILGNNHVLARLNRAPLGEEISQPGMIDNSCRVPQADAVGVLTGFQRLHLGGRTNRVDAAIAAALPGAVEESGAILGIGIPGRHVAEPRIGMAVQKSGRTTGLTRGLVYAVNVRVQVRYRSECADDAPVVFADFAKQLVIVSATDQPFSASGDSGAAVLEDVKPCPGFVGLFFAGSSSISVASRMDLVLKAARRMRPRGRAELVGCDQPPPARGLVASREVPRLEEAELHRARRAQARAEPGLFGLDGVHAVGIGRAAARPETAALKIFADTSRPDLVRRLPFQVDGIPVDVVHSGPIWGQGDISCEPQPDSGG